MGHPRLHSARLAACRRRGWRDAFGFTVSSKAVAKDGGGAKKRGMAVDRNRARRRLKEAVRLTFPEHAKPGWDYAIIGRGAALTRNFAGLLADMQLAFHKVSQPARFRVEPVREKAIYANVRAANKGPLPDIELTHIYERIIDVMRALQRDELASQRNALAHGPGHGQRV